MQKTKIVEEIFRNGTVKQQVEHFVKNGQLSKNRQEDYEYEIYNILLDMDEDKLNTLKNNKQLDFYIFTIVKNQTTNTLSSLNRKYNSGYLLAGDIKITEDKNNDIENYESEIDE